jgi:hypothetical protein
MVHNFQTETNRIKLLAECESLTQEGYIIAKQNYMSYTFMFRKHFYFVTSCLKIIDHGNRDNNLKSHVDFA